MVVVRVAVCKGPTARPIPTPIAIDTRLTVMMPHGALVKRTTCSVFKDGPR